MGAISRTCEEIVPLYISVFEGRNVNLDPPTVSGRQWQVPQLESDNLTSKKIPEADDLASGSIGGFTPTLL